ncbi:hypothetical protein [Mesorhizobium sp. M0296]|uniref:hypothetical protein n=1 Tax=Mesorhizobium sp. M0296 TaxID=2956931 RepID=UPI00333C2361
MEKSYVTSLLFVTLTSSSSARSTLAGPIGRSKSRGQDGLRKLSALLQNNFAAPSVGLQNFLTGFSSTERVLFHFHSNFLQPSAGKYIE